MNKPLTAYTSTQEMIDELDETFHKLLYKHISKTKYLSYELDINNNIYINQNVIRYLYVELLPDFKWKFITNLQNNGVQNTYIENYILNIKINVNKFIHYQLMSNSYINTYVL